MSSASDWVVKLCVATALSIALVCAPLPLAAQGVQTQDQSETQLLSQQELEQLVAPIALYPDALLAQILTASTYPLEVVMAARWSEKNPNVKGTALENAMEGQPWDPSVKGLASVPQVLAMMNDKIEWTEQLGEAFLAQPDDIQNAIQTLRATAETTGSLKSTKEQKVRRVTATPSQNYVGPPEYIVIEPVEPDYIYVPVYDPVTVYGVGFWPPRYVPFYWYPRWWTAGPVFGFAPALFVGSALWYNYNWGHRGFNAIQVNNTYYTKFNKVTYKGDKHWNFDPAHHKQPFKNAKLQKEFKNHRNDSIKNELRATGNNNRLKKDLKANKNDALKKVDSRDRTKDNLNADKNNKAKKELRANKDGKNKKELKTEKNFKPQKSSKRADKSVTGSITQKGDKQVKAERKVKAAKPNKSIKAVNSNKKVSGGKPNKQAKKHKK